MDFFYDEKYSFYRNVAAVIGILYITRLLIHLLCDFFSFFRAYILAPMGIGRTNLLKYGSWAVVTGASEGIGRGYAFELARRGLNIVLMSRSEEKLNKVADEIRGKYGRKTKVIPVDFSGGLDIYGKISNQLWELDVGVIVNNVGMSSLYPDIFTNISEERLYKIVAVNCHPTVQMTRLLLPRMISHGGGIIVNISSATSISATSQSIVYSATKVFINYISEGLHKEYADKGIVVQNVKPFLVATALTGMKKSNLLFANAISHARAAVATIGIQRDTYGCLSHAIQGYITTRTPEWLTDLIVANISNNIRAKWHYVMAKKNRN